MALDRLQPRYDVAVVGGGPAGLAAALGARDAGAERVLILDREAEPGGILLQCIHSGFGLHLLKQELTGPEYADHFVERVIDREVDVVSRAYVSAIGLDSDGRHQIRILREGHGIATVEAGAVVLAMGCRERTRGALRIPGTRPAGVLTAGLAQKLVNQLGLLPGRRVAVLGSGDIGLIMARRLTLEGCEVVGVFELMPHSNGLTRNVVQCLEDFGIPLHLSTTVTRVHGRDRVERVSVAPVAGGVPDLARERDVPCDTLLLSVGLIPENELSLRLGVAIDLATGGPRVSSTLMTSLPGVFACGNVLHVHDLVDYVSAEALLAGGFAGEYALGLRRPRDNVRLVAGCNVASCVPQSLATGREQTVYLRCREPMRPAVMQVGDLLERRLPFVVPAETIVLRLKPDLLDRFHGEALQIDLRPGEGAP